MFRSLHNLRIRVRIALLIFAVATSMLIVMSLAVYAAFSRQLVASLDDALRLRVTSNLAFVDAGTNPPTLTVFNDPGLERSEGEAVLRLYDRTGALLSDASPATGNGAQPLLAVSQAAAARRAVFATVDLGGEEVYRIVATPLLRDNAVAGVLVTGIELSRVNGPLGILRLILAIAVPATGIALGLGGYWIARRALHPVDAITATANRITQGDLSQRIDDVRSKDELGRLANTLNAMIERLHETMDRERRFTSDASHELRTPLTTIETSIEVTLSQDRDPAEYRRVLQTVSRQTRRLRSLTQQLLLLSRLDAKQAQGEFTAIELAGFLEAVVTGFRENHPSATLEYAPAVDSIDVRGDLELLARAFMNVLENAVVHAGPVVRIAMEVHREPDAAVVSIQDNGPGIAVDLAPEVFQRFRRGGRSRTGGGSGLGLAIMEAIVVTHGGTVHLAPYDPSNGARFELKLPLASIEPSAADSIETAKRGG